MAKIISYERRVYDSVDDNSLYLKTKTTTNQALSQKKQQRPTRLYLKNQRRKERMQQNVN